MGVWDCECVTPNNATVQGTSTGRKGRRRRRGEGEGGGGVPAPLCLSLTSVPQGKRRPSRPLIFLEAAFPSISKKSTLDVLDLKIRQKDNLWWFPPSTMWRWGRWGWSKFPAWASWTQRLPTDFKNFLRFDHWRVSWIRNRRVIRSFRKKCVYLPLKNTLG